MTVPARKMWTAAFLLAMALCRLVASEENEQKGHALSANLLILPLNVYALNGEVRIADFFSLGAGILYSPCLYLFAQESVLHGYFEFRVYPDLQALAGFYLGGGLSALDVLDSQDMVLSIFGKLGYKIIFKNFLKNVFIDLFAGYIYPMMAGSSLIYLNEGLLLGACGLGGGYSLYGFLVGFYLGVVF